MFCPRCGAFLPEGSQFCRSCGAAQADGATPIQQGVAQPVDKYQGFSMKWYKFLIYFGFWIAALVSFSSAGTLLSGLSYGENAENMYAMFENLKLLDMATGLAYAVVGVLLIVTALHMIKLKKGAPKLVLFTYTASFVIAVLYLGLSYVIMQDYLELTELLTPSTMSSLTTSAVMLFVNYSYFKKRAALFVN